MTGDRTAAEVLAELDPERVLRVATPEEGTARRITAVAAMAQAEALGRLAQAVEDTTSPLRAAVYDQKTAVRLVERLVFDLAEAGEYLEGIEDESGVAAGWRKAREEARAWLLLQGWKPGPEGGGA